MKLLRYGPAGHEKAGIVDGAGRIRDLSGIVRDLDADALSDEGLARIRAAKIEDLPLVPAGTRIGPCVARVGNFIGIGLNYTDHARETGAEAPKEPILFSKAPSCICGPDDTVLLPPGSVKSDWEVELAIVIGKRASYISEAEALDHVAGYCICNDISEREYQIERGGTWFKGKGCPTFGPLGPWLVTRDEVADVQNLDLVLKVNDEVVQNGSTSNMIFGVGFIVSYVSQFMILEPGDVITTGTPAGVGLGMKPPRYLKAGDRMHLTVTGLGEQNQLVAQA